MPNTFGLTHVKHIIAVSSCKGGVGKSTIAAHLTCELSLQGYKVGLLDADIYGPSLPTLFELYDERVHSNEFKMLAPIEHRGIKLMSFGFLIGDQPAVMRGPIVTRYLQQLLLQTDWGQLDYLIIDMPPGTGDVQLTITQNAQLTGALIVTTRQALSLVDVARGILMFEKVDVPILGLVENMAYYQCDSSPAKHYIFGQDPAKNLTERFGVTTIAQLPINPIFSNNVSQYQSQEHTRSMTIALLNQIKRLQQPSSIPAVHFDAEHIFITYTDGQKITLKNLDVRLACQCALCVDEVSGKKKLNPATIKAAIAPTAITPLGNYAINIAFNDGHNSGIYPYQMLTNLT